MGVLSLILQRGFSSIAGKPGEQQTSAPRLPTEAWGEGVVSRTGWAQDLEGFGSTPGHPASLTPTFPRGWSSICGPSAMCAQSPLARPDLLQ